MTHVRAHAQHQHRILAQKDSPAGTRQPASAFAIPKVNCRLTVAMIISSTIILMYVDASASFLKHIAGKMKCLTRVTVLANVHQPCQTIMRVALSLDGTLNRATAFVMLIARLLPIVALLASTSTHAYAIAKMPAI